MKIVEFQQRAEDGGFPVPNGNGFEHGEMVFAVAGRDLIELMEKVKLVADAFVPCLPRIAYTPIKELNELLVEVNEFQREHPNMFVFPRSK